MNKTDTKILVCCHTNDIYKSDEQYFPIHVGKEIWDKITHYAHADDFSTKEWYENVWLNSERVTNLHPTTPETLPALIDSELPQEIESLGL